MSAGARQKARFEAILDGSDRRHEMLKDPYPMITVQPPARPAPQIVKVHVVIHGDGGFPAPPHRYLH